MKVNHLFVLLTAAGMLGLLSACNLVEQSKKPFRRVGSGLSQTNKILNPFRTKSDGRSKKNRQIRPVKRVSSPRQTRVTGADFYNQTSDDNTVSFANKRKAYYVIEIGGKRRSRGIRTRSNTTYDRQPCVKIKKRQETTRVRNGISFTDLLLRESITGTNDEAYYSMESKISGGEKFTKIVAIKNGVARFRSEGPGGNTQSTLKVPKGIAFGIEPDWLLAQGISVGRHYSAKILDRGSKQILTEKAVVREQKTIRINGIPARVWVVDTTREGNPAAVQMTFTDAGDVVRIELDTLVYRMVTREEYDRKATPAVINSVVPFHFFLPAWDNYSSLVFAAKNPAAWRPYIKSSEYVKVVDRDGQYQLTLQTSMTKARDKVKASTLPMQISPALQPYLEPGPRIFPQKRDIYSLAKRIVGRENRTLQAVAKLVFWVHKAIRFKGTDALNPTPLQTLATRGGDCSEHADLFSSLARSVGIPTRTCQGLRIQKDQAIFHAWVEVWIAGEWVPVDTTVNRVGLPAGYLLTSRSGPDGVPRDSFGWALQKGGLDLRLLAARKLHLNAQGKIDTLVLIPGKKRTYLGFDDTDPNWIANLWWGFSLRKPASKNWINTVKKNRVTLQHKGTGAQLTLEGLPNIIRASQAGIDIVVDSLAKHFAGSFRKRDARIVMFGGRKHPSKGYATPAIMVDFSFSQRGKNFFCRQYVVPRNGRSYRLSLIAPNKKFAQMLPEFQRIMASIEL